MLCSTVLFWTFRTEAPFYLKPLLPKPYILRLRTTTFLLPFLAYRRFRV